MGVLAEPHSGSGPPPLQGSRGSDFCTRENRQVPASWRTSHPAGKSMGCWDLGDQRWGRSQHSAGLPLPTPLLSPNSRLLSPTAPPMKLYPIIAIFTPPPI